MAKRRSLGRGLDALIDTSAVETKFASVPLESIVPSGLQPRADTDEDIEELVASVKGKGVLQPVILKNRGGFYELVAGERRFRAAMRAGLSHIPAVIYDLNDRESLEVALTENLQRKDLSPVEEARAYHTLAERYSLTHEEIAKVLGKSRAAVTNSLRILSLPAEVLDMVHAGGISEGHARALLRLGGPKEQVRTAKAVVARGLSVRDLENSLEPRARRRAERVVSEWARERSRALSERLGARVSVKEGKRFTVSVTFADREAFERFLEKL